MYIKKADENKKEMQVSLPLTTPTGKIRIKERNNNYENGLPFSTKQKPIHENCYLEWQISYDMKTEDKNIDMSTLKHISFHNNKNEKRIFYELSEYLYYLYKWKIIEKKN